MKYRTTRSCYTPAMFRILQLPAVRSWLPCILLLMLVTPGLTQEETVPGKEAGPVDIKKQEDVEVDLVLIDAVVLDRQGRTVPGLKPDDFEVIVDQEIRRIDTLDELCDAGAMDDPRGVRHPRKRPPIAAPDTGRKIALVFDYLHMSNFSQLDALRSAREMVEHGATAGEQIMVAALNGGLRIEQGFTDDTETILDTLTRMEHDISLWGGRYAHLTEEPFFRGLQVLVDVLSLGDGSKAIVLYSDIPSTAEGNDLAFLEIASSAAGARCSVYPVDVKGLETIAPG